MIYLPYSLDNSVTNTGFKTKLSIKDGNYPECTMFESFSESTHI